MANSTVGDLIKEAQITAGIIGVGQTPLAEDSNTAFKLSNYLLAQWNRKRWIVYDLVDTPLTSTGAQSYTVGPGGSFNITRTDRLEFAYFRLLNTSGQNQVDFPCQILPSREDYSRIALKSLVTWPSYAFLDSGYPMGNVFFWPIPPASQYEMHILTKNVLQAFANFAQVINLPPEYEMALLYNLAVRLRVAYQLPPDQTLIALAAESLNIIRSANAQVPRLTMPTAIRRRGLYNPYSDQMY